LITCDLAPLIRDCGQPVGFDTDFRRRECFLTFATIIGATELLT